MKVLVTGASGQLGYDVCKVLVARGVEHRGVDIQDFDITDAAATRSYIVEYCPDAVVHCSAWTAVDRAEDEPEKCRAVNMDGTRNIAVACKEIGAKMLYISTDYVFSETGRQFHEPDDETGPLNVYGQTKLEGELAVKELLTRFFIVRTSWVFGINGKNFVRTMLELGAKDPALRITADEFGSPTYTRDLAPLLCDMVLTERYGVYHATNEGICTWAEFAQEIFDQAGMRVSVTPRTPGERLTKTNRPHNSRLSKRCLDKAGFTRLPHWKDALRRYLQELTV